MNIVHKQKLNERPLQDAARQPAKAGRPPVEIDLVELEKLSSLHCTDQEIADWFGVSTRTIESRRKRPDFAAAIQRGRSKGRISVRRAQMKMLETGSSAMGFWLGKQMLGQRDMITTEHVGMGGGPVQVSFKPDLSKLTDEELQQLLNLAGKTSSPAKTEPKGLRESLGDSEPPARPSVMERK